MIRSLVRCVSDIASHIGPCRAGASRRAGSDPLLVMVFAGFSRDKRHSRRHVAGMRRFLPLLILLLLFCAALVLLPGRGVGWESLARHQDMLIGWVAAHPFGAPALYVAAYILTAAL